MEKSQSPYTTSAAVSCVVGRAGCGKTEYIVSEVARLIKAGTQARDIIVFAASESASSELATRLKKVLDELGKKIGKNVEVPKVTTLPQYELDILSTPEAVTFTGRQARVLLRFEENILMEDMKTSEIHPKRLREMLRFFYRSWAELESMDTAWFYSDEEEKVHTLLKRYLDYFEAYLPAEIGRSAYDFLALTENVPNCIRRKHVFVDDYQTLSKASQCATGLLALETLTITGDSLETVTCIEEFPHPTGLDEIVEANPNCKTIELKRCYKSAQVNAALNKLTSDSALDSIKPVKYTTELYTQIGHFETIAFARPHDEFDGIASIVENEIAGGMPAQEIAIAASCSIWEKNICRALSARDISISRVSKPSIGGDVRDVNLCMQARAVTLLKLAANPVDQLALRCWCGFGDHLANSGIIKEMVKRHVPFAINANDINLPHDQNSLFAQEEARIFDALQQAQAALEAIEGLQGNDLLCAICLEISKSNKDTLFRELSNAIGSIPQNANAQTMLSALQERCLFPRFIGNGVRVGLAHEFVGTNPSVMILAGFVNGLTPKRSYFDPTIVERDKRPEILAREMRKTYSGASKAHDKLIISYFTEALLPDAEKLQLKISRVRLLNKERVCEIHPSETIRAITGDCFND